MKKSALILLLTFFLMSGKSWAKHLHLESEYQNYWCKNNNGVTEFILSDSTRVDCLTKDLAVEFDFAPKWHECIGQALYYGNKTGRTPACVLIMERGEKDLRYLKRLRRTVYDKKQIQSFRTFTITPERLEKHMP